MVQNDYTVSIRWVVKTLQCSLPRCLCDVLKVCGFLNRDGYGFLILCYCISPPSSSPPRHKLQYFKDIGWQDEWIETARDIVRAEFECKYLSLEVQDVPTSQKVCL